VAAVNATLQVGSISRAAIARELAGREAPQVAVRPRRHRITRRRIQLRLEDIEYLRERMVGFQAISTGAWFRRDQVVFQNQQANVAIDAVSQDYLLTSGRSMVQGRFFNATDFAKYRPVVVINQVLAEELFPDANPINQRIYGRNMVYVVVGVMETKVRFEGDRPQMKILTIEDVVFLAVENNRDIKNAYLDRIIQRGDLEIAEDKFVPNLTPQLSIDALRNSVSSSNTDTRNADISAEVYSRIPTGGELRVQWRGTGQNQETNPLTGGDENSLTQNLQLSFEQPLFRGFGIDVNRASMEIARLNEANNILALKSTIVNTITNAIQRYRVLLRAQEQLKIGQLALESAKRQL